jgi:hypothetical protein
VSIGTVVGFAGSPGSSQTATPTATLPTITTAGKAYALVGTNLGSTTTVTTPPSGWVLEAGPVDNASNNMRVWLYSKDVTSADTGGTFTLTLSGASRWGVGGAYLPGGAGIDVSVQWIDNTDDTSIDIPAITPGVADAYRLVLVYDRSVSGALSVTPPGGWNELADVCSTNGSGARFGAWVGGVQLVGQSGVAQGIASATYSTSARNNGWQLTIAPAATTVTGSGAGTLPSATGTGAGSLTDAGSGAGTLPGPTGSGAGQVRTTGSGTATLPGLAGAGSAAVATSGSGAGALPPLTGAGSGSVGSTAVTGSGAATLPGLTGTGAGGLLLTGSGAATLAAPTATGTTDLTVPGSMTGTLEQLVAAGAGDVATAGAGAADLPALAGAGAGTVVDPATFRDITVHAGPVLTRTTAGPSWAATVRPGPVLARTTPGPTTD